MKNKMISVFVFLLLFFVGLNAMKKGRGRGGAGKQKVTTAKEKSPEKKELSPQQATEKLMQVLQDRDLIEQQAMRKILPLLEAGAEVDKIQIIMPICSAANRGWLNVLRLFIAKLRKDYGDNEQKYLNLFCKEGGYGPLYWAICGTTDNRYKCVLEILRLLELINFEKLIRAVLQHRYFHHRFRDKSNMTLIELAETEKAGEKVIGLLVAYFAKHEIEVEQDE